jgi:hypothetical protein
MNLETRKIEFIQEFLKITNEEVVSQLENLLKGAPYAASQTFSKKEQVARIKQSEADFDNGRFKSSEELTEKYRS